MPSSCTRFIGYRWSPATTDTSVAPRRSVRITVSSLAGCAPSVACGSCALPVISSSMTLLPSGPEQPGDRPQRDRQPARPVPGLVRRLVDSFVELVRAQQGLVLARVGARGTGVALAERGAVALDPYPGPGGQPLVVVVPVDHQLVRRVLEGAQHPCDV